SVRHYVNSGAYRGETVLKGMTGVVEELALANRILAHEGVLDAFGHVSMRHPTLADRYLLSRSRSPLLIEPDDILEFTLDSEPVRPAKALLYAERVIHGCIYRTSCITFIVHGGVGISRREAFSRGLTRWRESPPRPHKSIDLPHRSPRGASISRYHPGRPGKPPARASAHPTRSGRELV